MTDTLIENYKYRIQELLNELSPIEKRYSRAKLHQKLGVGLTRFKAIVNARKNDKSVNATLPQMQIIADHFGVSMDYMCYRD